MRLAPRAPLAAALVALSCGLDDEPEPVGGPPPPGFATEILAAHNAVRAGSVVTLSPAPAPPLPALAWSADAAAVAQAWADGCVWAHNPGRGERGENIAAATPGSLADAEVVALWAREWTHYDWATNTCDASAANPDGTCGHYTQLVWRTTTVVGCGRRTCTTGSPFGSGSWDYWVCDYAPPGNWIGQRPY